MLGEIIKSTEALRYHAKSAEIAGKNLAHVNDENYARQRVLAKEGLMYNGQGGLRTSSIEVGGLDHARNELIDKRLFSEFGETSKLEAQQEILKLLQAALGEKVDRQSVDGGLDDQHDSNLSEGGLARAMDDLFSAFQELSASPDAKVASQDIFNKLQTLTKRLNDAGSALDDIDTDLTESVAIAVEDVNRLLRQIEEVNIQIRRFELLGQGLAVSYRDQRQKLLEDLSKQIDFRTEPEINQSGVETGFLNILTKDKTGRTVSLLDAENGRNLLTKDFGNIEFPDTIGAGGAGLQSRVKITEDGALGHIEVLDGGSQYDDSNGPLILTYAPPLVRGFEVSLQKYSKFEYFEQDGRYYQALDDIPAGTSLTNPLYFSEKSGPISLSNRAKDEFFEQNGSYYKSLLANAAGYELADASRFEKLQRPVALSSYDIGDKFKQDGKYYETKKDAPAGSELTNSEVFNEVAPFTEFAYNAGAFFEENGDYYKAVASLDAQTSLGSPATFVKLGSAVAVANFEIGDIIEVDGSYYEAIVAGSAGASLSDETLFATNPVSTEAREVDEVFEQGGKTFKALVATEPNALLSNRNFFEEQSLAEQNYATGDVFEVDGLFYQALSDGSAGALLSDETLFTKLDSAVAVAPFQVGDIIQADGIYYEASVAGSSGALLSDEAIFTSNPVSTQARTVDEVFEQGGKTFRALVATEPNALLSDNNLFQEQIFADKEYSRGEFFEADGSFYEVVGDQLVRGTALSSPATFYKLKEPVSLLDRKEGEFFEVDGQYYEVLGDSKAGNSLSASEFKKVGPVSLVDYNKGDIFLQDGNYYEVLQNSDKWTSLDNEQFFLSKSDPVSLIAHSQGSLFSQNGKYYQAIDNVAEGTPLSDTLSFIEIQPSSIPSDGNLTGFPETLRRYSDLETFKQGEKIYYEGQLLHVTQDINPVSKYVDSLEKRDYKSGEVVRVGNEYFQFLQDVAKEDSDFDALKNNATSLLSLGADLPLEVEELSYFSTSIGENQRFFASKSYQKEDIVKIFDSNVGQFRYFELSGSFFRDDEFLIGFDPDTDSDWMITDADGTVLAKEYVDETGEKIDPARLSKSVLLNGGTVLIDSVYEKDGTELNTVIARAQAIEDFKTSENPMRFRQNEVYYFKKDDGSDQHFIVTDALDDISPLNFNPADDQWRANFKMFSPQLVEDGKPELFFKRAHPKGYDSLIEDGSLVEINLGIAEAVINDGQITGFNILNSGSNLAKSDSVFVNGRELDLELGSIKGLQNAKANQVSRFREKLNSLVSEFVKEINGIYNPEENPGDFLFGFDAVLTRPVVGKNTLMEDEYGFYGREGDGDITLYREEVAIQLPVAESETFNIVNVTPVFPEDFKGQQYYVRGEDNAQIDFGPESTASNYSFYGSARRMQNVTMENDPAYSGDDKIVGTADDGRSYMMAYSAIPFRLEGMEPGSRLPIIGDNFSFQALPSNPWNLASSIRTQTGLSAESISATRGENGGGNEIALGIAEMGDGSYLDEIALLNADLGNALSDLSDNLEHQQSIENVLLDQRRSVSSVSIDEEVADLMRFQRSFQASSRVLSTLDKMLEIVVMGLVR